MTVAQLLEYLTSKLANKQIDLDYAVAIWVKDQGGYETKDIRYPREVDNNLRFVSFSLD